jgi:4-hydroxy-3-methylbut-2-enyl diphosphate reductase
LYGRKYSKTHFFLYFPYRNGQSPTNSQAMKVIRARVSGFCMGVRRALNMAVNAKDKKKKVYTLGPLIHNRWVLDRLKQSRIDILDEKESYQAPPESIIIIRAHGVAPQLEGELRSQGFRILDATCPHVKESQKKVCSFAEKGYCIFLAGEKNHAEIIGMRGYAEEIPNSRSMVVADRNEAERAAMELVRFDASAKTVLIGQTTISKDEYREIGRSIKRYYQGLEILDSICKATIDRQEALKELCGQVEALIIVGAKDSANTNRLLALAQGLARPAWIVETREDIPSEIRNSGIVGLSAGASTPDALIDEIEEALISLNAY